MYLEIENDQSTTAERSANGDRQKSTDGAVCTNALLSPSRNAVSEETENNDVLQDEKTKSCHHFRCRVSRRLSAIKDSIRINLKHNH